MNSPIKKENVLGTTEKHLNRALNNKRVLMHKINMCENIQTWIDNYAHIIEKLGKKQQKRYASRGVKTMSELLTLLNGETGEHIWHALGVHFAVAHGCIYFDEKHFHYLVGNAKALVSDSLEAAHRILNPQPKNFDSYYCSDELESIIDRMVVLKEKLRDQEEY